MSQDVLDAIRAWTPLALTVISGLIAWATWSARREFATSADIRRLSETDASIDRRLAIVEARLADLPTEADLAAVRATLEHVREDQRAVRAALARIEEFLLRERRP